MKKIMLFLVGSLCCLWLTGCAVPGPYYAGADCPPGPVVVNPVRAVVATGAAFFDTVFHHSRYYYHRVTTPYIYRTPTVYPLPPMVSGPYIYR
jgi:hypothetical protein